jgi:uncharacterized protein YjbI with pentapeptide repeats
MAIEDKLQPPPLSPKQLPLFSPEDEKKAQQELARLRKKEKGASKTPQWFGFKGKTLWDWLQLLGVPILLAGATIGFSFVQFYLADQQHASDQKIANQQHDTDQQNALDQQHATTLQTYIDNIQELLLKDNLFGNNPAPKNEADQVTIQEVRELARARTLTALQGLDPVRKGRLVQFLYEAQLIGFLNSNFIQQDKIITLNGADLSNANLYSATLYGANLSGANLSNADLTLANLRGAILNDARLWGTQLQGADLSNADLTLASLFGAGLNGAHLNGANLSNADLFGAGLIGANLSGANLSGANLLDTGLLFADLRGVNLSGANLSEANLSNATLSGALFLTQQQLDQVSSCKDTILPTGLLCHKKYE